jgi:serine/threonine protein kinase
MTITNYTIKQPIGQGGMATVYLAHDNKFDSSVAIKILNKEFIHNENIRKRFLAEAKNMFRMSHSNIIKVTDLIDEGDTVAFVMEYMEGQTLKEYLDTKEKLNDDEIKKLFVQMLDAVGYVHEKGLIHRDIKPSNFMISGKGVVKLLDFGIAKNTDTTSADYTQTGTAQSMGTPMYMSPEQIKSTKDVTAQSDIYSLGVVLWQMVTGKKPYDTSTLSTFDLQLKIVTDQLPYTDTVFDKIITPATEKELSKRYKKCEDVKDEIQKLNKTDSESTKIYVSDKLHENNVDETEDKTIVETQIQKELLIEASIIGSDGYIKYGVINIKGDWVISPNYQYVSIEDDGLIVEQSDKCGYMDFNGNWKILPKFDGISGFDKFGFSIAKKISTSFFNSTSLYGIIDKKGNWVVQPNFEILSSSDKYGYFEAKINNKYGLIDNTGKWILKPSYESLYGFDEIGYNAQLKGRVGKIDIKGNWKIPPQFDGLHSFDKQGYCVAAIKDKFGLVDVNGIWKVNPNFDFLAYDDTMGYIAEIKGKWGKINTEGEWILTPFYDHLESFLETTYSIAAVNGKYGFLNYRGEWLLKPTYWQMKRINNEFYKAAIDLNKYGIINFRNEWILPPIYDYFYTL